MVDRAARILAAVAAADGSLLERVCAAAAELTGTDGGALVVMADGHPGGIVAASDETAGRLEELQFTFGEGPSLDAHRGAGVLVAGDLAARASDAWVGFGPAAVDMGVAAMFAVPLRAGGVRAGVLSLYRSTPGGWSEGQLADAEAVAAMALQVVLGLQARVEPGQLPALMAEATMPWQVHQATGVIAAREAITPAEALVRLRAHAFVAGISLREVADGVLADGLDLDRAG